MYHIGREDLLSHMTQLQSFFMTCFNIRIDYPEVSKVVSYRKRGSTKSHDTATELLYDMS